MSTFSKTNFKTLNYNTFRPKYPPSFYKLLSQYATKGDEAKLPLKKSIDLGCGTGVATYPLLNISQQVIGLDLSSKMIEIANSLVEENTGNLGIDKSRILYKTGGAEDFLQDKSSSVEPGSIDLITAAQCIHWFQDFPKFFKNCHKILKLGGTLSYFFYLDPIIVDYHNPGQLDVDFDVKLPILHQAQKLYNQYIYEDPAYLGPHWEQPGRDILKHLCKQVNEVIPLELYEDITINTFLPDIDSGKVDASDLDLDLNRKNITPGELINYLSTYSSYHNFKEKTGDKIDVFGKLLQEFQTQLSWDDNTTIDIVWNTGYTFIRKK
jgi:SAM-dependent methyltransferase